MKTLQIAQVTPDGREEWDALVAREPSFALHQSWGWGEFKERLGWKALRVGVRRDGTLVAGAQMLIRPVPLGVASYAYVPRGPVGAWLDDDVAAPLLRRLDRIAGRNRSVVLRVEPAAPHESRCAQVLQQNGFQAARRSNQPRATTILDLEQGTDRLFAGMSRYCRRSIRRAATSGVTVRVGGAEDLVTLSRLMQITGRRARFRVRDLDYYRHLWEALSPSETVRLFIASYEGTPLAANLSAVFGAHGASLVGGSSNAHKELCANHLLLWEAIRWSEERECRTHDLWGVPDEVGYAALTGVDLPFPTRTDGLWGVWGYKRGFQGRVSLYTAAHDHIYSAPVRAAYGVVGSLIDSPVLDRLAVWGDSLRRRRERADPALPT